MLTSQTAACSLRARYLFPIDRPPIRNGWITISRGRIVAVGDRLTGVSRDLGDVAILPGLINAHTHLEFSDLHQPLGRVGMPLPDWIREVIRWRRQTAELHVGSDWRQQAVHRGLAESIRGGATNLGEIATLPCNSTDRRYVAMRGVCFLELLELATSRHDELLNAAAEFVAAAARQELYQAGLSPHAPYTVSPRLVASIAALSARTRKPVAMHLAETREEIELLQTGGGPFRELLDELGVWESEAVPCQRTPLNYLQALANADRSLIIHGNYLGLEEIEFLGQQRERMSVVYCPRTHAYFAHDRYPLQQMTDYGVDVALGTDSRASNPDLNLLNEIRFAAEQHPDISLESILRLATSHAAKALGMARTHGSLTPGKQADLTVIAISADEPSDPHELIFESVHGVEQVFQNGEQRLETGIVDN